MARMNGHAPVEVTYKNMRFLITHNPTNATLKKFIEDWPFDDGTPPSNQIVDDWLSFVEIRLFEEPRCCIAVHCVAGLGRATVRVALALIEGGMKHEAAVQFIRQKRHGAFNSKQLCNKKKFRPKMWLRFKDDNGHRNNCCIQ
ncbi:protein tyrosine phosphatase type IVA 1-like isoform X3 [Perognathus longimembris pacificus]|uniref:protein tyrosine phosphatase type IVA 1-like isoform X3 n=1 Tax=Perognathus longimembris pacificus TaxID=214514 RepID=UPI00201850F1|nr:protein tyrosine phosphatase type IVA 1-like isoform X3 [Perognathus longimembris pacificus]